MGRELIRQDIATAVNAAVEAYEAATGQKLIVEYDNRIIVDTKTAQDPFLQVSVRFIDSGQRELSNTPHTRYDGQIEVSVAVKEGGGTAVANTILDFLNASLQRRAMGTVRTFTARAVNDKPHLGWVYYPSLIPFWSDQIS